MRGEFPDVNTLAQILSQISTAHWSHADFTAKFELLESLKDNLINQSSHDDDGFILREWLDTALVFINECENVFNSPQNADFINFLTPNISNQLVYIRNQLQGIATTDNLTRGQIDRFRHIFLISALGFVAKLKLIIYILAATCDI